MTNLCFGKLPKVSDYRTLQMEDFVPVTLPPPPPSSGNLMRVYRTFGTTDPTQMFLMDGNDTVGDCTIAGLAHLATMFNGFLGRKVIPSKADVLAFYSQLTGGQDTGLDLLSVLKYIRKNEWLGEKPILAFVEVPVHDPVRMKQAVALGGTYTGMIVQANAIQEFDQRKPWTPGRLTNDGHCVVDADYTPQDDVLLTWGNTQLGTPAWQKKCVDEAYLILPAEAQEAGFAPGFDYPKLMDALKAFGAVN